MGQLKGNYNNKFLSINSKPDDILIFQFWDKIIFCQGKYFKDKNLLHNI